MKICATCKRKILDEETAIEAGGLTFCSHPCRQTHLSKSDEELEQDERAYRMACIKAALPLFFLGCAAFFVPFTILICVVFHGDDISPGFIVKDALFMLPGVAIMSYSYLAMNRPRR